jgi:hypothetical protein
VRVCVGLVAVATALTGCVTTPQFDKSSGVTPKTVVDVIACELIEARDKICRRNRELANLPPVAYEPCLGLRQTSVFGRPLANLSNWTAVAELTLTVDEQATLAPSFAHTDVVSKSLTRAFDWGVKYSTEAQRIYTESVTFQIGNLRKKDGRCDTPPTRVSLNGHLGLDEVVEMAFGSVDEHDTGIGFSGDLFDGPKKSYDSGKTPSVKSLPFLRRQPRVGGRGGSSSQGKKEASFGTSIEFVVTKGISSTGPTWTLAQFKGPGRLFSGERQNTHKLRISFARRSAGDPSEAMAEREAKQVNQQLLLEGLAPKLRQSQ